MPIEFRNPENIHKKSLAFLILHEWKRFKQTSAIHHN